MYLLQQSLNAISVGGVYALVAVGFALIYSVLKFSNWSHGAVIMLSSYIGFFTTSRLGLPLIPAVAITTLSGGVLAVIIELIAFRPIRLRNGPLIYFFVTSITMAIGTQFLVLALLGGNFYRWPELITATAINLGPVTLSTLNLSIRPLAGRSPSSRRTRSCGAPLPRSS